MTSVEHHANGQVNLANIPEGTIKPIVQLLDDLHWQDVGFPGIKTKWEEICNLYPDMTWSQELRTKIAKSV